VYEASDYINAVSWSKYPVAVTLRKEDEPRSSSTFQQAVCRDPYIIFDNFLNGENITQEDLVLWFTVGLYHLPGGEDVPTTTTPGNYLSVFIKPSNYFDEDPTTDMKDTEVIVPDANGNPMITTYYTPAPACVPDDITPLPFNGTYG